MQKSNQVFIGADSRQPVSYNVLQYSIMVRSSKPVQITPLVISQLPLKRAGLTPFTYSRFLVPWLCNYEGWSLFLDADMLVLDDIVKLFDLADDRYAVMVVKNSIRYEWASVMLMNCEKCRALTPEFVEKTEGLTTLNWLEESEIGELPAEWNHLVGYDEAAPGKSLIHFTQGVPAFPEVRGCEYEQEWFDTHREMNSFQNWQTILASSTHSKWFVKGFLPTLAKSPVRTRLWSWLWYKICGNKDGNVCRPRTRLGISTQKRSEIIPPTAEPRA